MPRRTSWPYPACPFGGIGRRVQFGVHNEGGAADLGVGLHRVEGTETAHHACGSGLHVGGGDVGETQRHLLDDGPVPEEGDERVELVPLKRSGLFAAELLRLLYCLPLSIVSRGSPPGHGLTEPLHQFRGERWARVEEHQRRRRLRA